MVTVLRQWFLIGNRSWFLLAMVEMGILPAALGGVAVPGFGGNAQHTSVYTTPAQDLAMIRWKTTVDLNGNAASAHYGSPLITASNTVLVPVKTAINGFRVDVFDGTLGAAKYTLTSDYILPSHSWIPTYNPALAMVAGTPRLYYAGAGGTVWYVDNPDSNSHGLPTRVAFFGTSAYSNNISGFNSTVFVNTPITADSKGNVYYGFRVQGTAPAPLSTSMSGFVRVDSTGNAVHVLANQAANNSSITNDSHNSAPALSIDESTVYVVAKQSTGWSYNGYLLGLDSTTLTNKYRVLLKDPRSGRNAGILDDSTASPMVAPDGDVYLGVFSNPDNGSRGFLLRFSGDLSVTKTPGGFGWDYTPAFVPSSVVPNYTGPSSYLIFSKYNYYAGLGGGDGVNRIALLDPNVTQMDGHPSASGPVEMREVMTTMGVTPDPEYYGSTYPYAIREWCINSAAVNPATHSIFTPSEDGSIYRWNLSENSLSQTLKLGSGIGEPYVPTVIGGDGTVYTLNGGTLFAMGNRTGIGVLLTSSSPDATTLVAGQSVTFTATVSNPGPSATQPTGTVSFTDITYQDLVPVTNTLASGLALDSNGRAAVTTSALTAGAHFLGNHLITVVYSGDGIFPSVTVSRIQKVHANASATTLTASTNGGAVGTQVTFTATVAGVPSNKSTGMVTLWDGTNVMGQMALTTGGTVVFSSSNLTAGHHSIVASYASDTTFAASSGSMVELVGPPSATTTSVAVLPNPANWGQAMVVMVTVSALSGGGVPTGSITISDGAVIIASNLPLDANGMASITNSSLGIGSHTLSAAFTPTVDWLPSAGTGPAVTVQEATSLVVNAFPNPAVSGQPVTLTATVSGLQPSAGTPSGMVTLSDQGGVLASGIPVDASGQATSQFTSLTVGSHSIAAVFTGNTGWLNSSAAASQPLVITTDPGTPEDVPLLPVWGVVTLVLSASALGLRLARR